MRRVLFSVITLLFAYNVDILAQESSVTKNADGKDFSQLKYAWHAQWITHPDASTLDFGSFLFRRSFELSSKPESFMIHISADNRYRLYVNGHYVGMGPETGDINNYRYETRDIASMLNEGRNVIAAEVINYGEFRKASQMTFQTAFICQIDASVGRSDLDTGFGGWKVVRNEGRGVTPFASNFELGYYVAGPGDILYCDKFPWGWEQLGFDDARWSEPRAATVEFAVGRGFLYGSTWFLTPRELPYVTERRTDFARAFIEQQQVDIPFAKNVWSIPANTQASVLLDHGHHTIGMPEIVFSKGRGAQIKVTYSEALYDKDMNKGHRDDVSGKRIIGYYDLAYPDGGVGRKFAATAMKTYRYVQVDIKTADQPLEISDFYGVNTTYPFTIEGAFRCDDSVINKIYDAACLTLRNSSYEDFIDPYFEQLQYIGDARIEALAALSMSSDLRLMRKAIETFDNSRLPLGLTQSRYPSYIVQIIPPYSLIWIGMIYDYMMYGGDMNFIRQRTNGMMSVLDWFSNHIDDTGLLYDLRWWNFTDWATGYPSGIPPGADDGHSTNISLQYALALQKAAKIFSELENDKRANELTQQAEKIVSAVNNRCFAHDRQMYREAVENNIFSQHTQILAVLSGAVDPKRQGDFLRQIIADKSLIQTTLYFKFYMFEAMLQAGIGDLYTQNLNSWRELISMGLTTFPETDINPRSECHGWSASPAYHLLNIVAGIRPARPGFNQVIIEPHMGPLTGLEACIPTPNGKIEVRYELNAGKLTAQIVLPKESTGIFVWHGRQYRLNEGLNRYTKI